MSEQHQKIVCESAALSGYIWRTSWSRSQHDDEMTFVDYDWATGQYIGTNEDGSHVTDAVPVGGMANAGPPPAPKPIDFEMEYAYVKDSDPRIWVTRRLELGDDGNYNLGPWLLFDTLTPYVGGGILVPAGGAAPENSQANVEIQSGWVIDANKMWHFYQRLFDEESGTWGSVFYTDMPGGSATSPAAPVVPAVEGGDRELQSFCYKVVTTSTLYAVGEELELVRLHDVTSPTPEVPLQSWWVNKTQGTTLAFTDVDLSHVQPCAPEVQKPVGRYTETYRLDGDLAASAVAKPWIRSGTNHPAQSGLVGDTVKIEPPYKAIHLSVLRGTAPDAVLEEHDASWSEAIGYALGIGFTHATQIPLPAADSSEELNEAREFHARAGCKVQIDVLR